MAHDISLIILNYNNAGLTRECVKNIKAHETKAGIEIIVVDNSNDARLAETLELRYPDVRYIPMRSNVGYARGNNAGIAAAKGRYIAIVNYDITPLAGAFDELLAYMDAHAAVGVAGPRLHNPDGSVQESCYRFHTVLTPMYRRLVLGKFRFGKKHLDAFLMKDTDISEPCDVDWLLGAFLFVRREALAGVGLFDERFFLYFEDTDWCRRFWNAGWRVQYAPHVHMLHLHLRDSAHTMGLHALFNQTTRIHVYSGIKYFIKQWSGGYRNVTKEKKETSVRASWQRR